MPPNPPKSPKIRLDQYLVEAGLCANKSQAQRQVLAGLVKIDGQVADKAGMLVRPETMATCQLDVGPPHPYVSRGGLKLAKALSAFGILPQDKTCLDVGASTGGFTDCLLQQGARQVYAVDVGYGQLDWRLRQDARVVVMEKTNIRTANPVDFPLNLSLATVDVSFISLKKVLPAMAALMTPAIWVPASAPLKGRPTPQTHRESGSELPAGGTTPSAPAGRDIIALLKPQFEYKDYFAFNRNFTGVVSDPEEHRTIITGVLNDLPNVLPGWQLRNFTFSPITGPKGNIEFLLHLAMPRVLESTASESAAGISEDAVAAVLAESYRLLQ